MSLIKTMGASPLTGTIYYGTLNTEKRMWVGQKTDVTDMACQAVAEYLMHKKISRVYGLPEGKELVLGVEVRRTAEPEAQQLTAAARDVLAERNRQQSVEGWTPEHDDAHNGGELARAAACYARHASARGGIYAENPAVYQAEGEQGTFSGHTPETTPPTLLTANSELVSFDWEGDAVELLNALARARGLQFSYSGVRLPLPVTLHVRDMTFANALRLIEAQTAWRATLHQYPGLLNISFMQPERKK